MTLARYITCAETAKLIRTTLKRAFPGTKFSVQSKTYSGGASIRVNYEDGPSHDAVSAIACQFSGATFDGMQDLKEYHSSQLDGERVHFGADYVFVSQQVSDARRKATEAAILTLSDRELNNLEAKVNMGRRNN